MPAGYTDEEFVLFTKTERRILTLIHEHGYDADQIKEALDIKDSTFRGHRARIRRKVADIQRSRYDTRAEEDAERQSKIHLPEFDTDQTPEEEKKKSHDEQLPELTVPPSSHSTMDLPTTFTPGGIRLEKIEEDVSLLPQPVSNDRPFGSI